MQDFEHGHARNKDKIKHPAEETGWEESGGEDQRNDPEKL